MAKQKQQWEVIGAWLTYPGADGKDKRVMCGEVVDDIPERSWEWLEAQGYITAIVDVEEGA